MKGRVQKKNGYLYIVIARGKGLTPKWMRTGLKDTAANNRIAKKMVEPTIEEYQAELRRDQDGNQNTNVENTIVSMQEASFNPESPLFTDIIKQYLPYAKMNVKANTYDKYEYAATKHIIPYFLEKGIQIARLTTLNIQDYFSVKIGSGLSKESLKYHRTVINQTLKYAIKPLKLISTNPATDIRLGKSPDTVVRYYDVDQLRELLDKVAQEGNQITAPVILAAYYGLRRSEVLGLQWDGVKIELKFIELFCPSAIRQQAAGVFLIAHHYRDG